jgi:hypothetical protein
MQTDSMLSINRRRFVKCSSGAVAAATVSSRLAWAAESPAATPNIQVQSIRTISPTPELYCGWPTLTRRRNGQLLVVWSGGRQHHVCPFGRVDMMRSDDEGETWTWPRTLLDSVIDDRDAGILETSKGTLLVTTFTSLAYQSQLDRQVAMAAQEKSDGKAWPASKLDRWLSVHRRVGEAERQAELGQWIIRSTDGGLTWSSRQSSVVNSPHGPIELQDGRLLYAGVKLWDADRGVGVCQSVDDGQTWNWLSAIPTRQGDDSKNYHELHAVQADSGKLIVHIRNHNPNHHRETLQTESDDGGKTWTEPHPIGVWGLPSFLNKLADGRLLMSYGHRRKPLGVQARLSSDEGSTWSGPLIIWGEGTSGDLGYPSTVELPGGDLLTVWYERLAGSEQAVLRQARWRISG